MAKGSFDWSYGLLYACMCECCSVCMLHQKSRMDSLIRSPYDRAISLLSSAAQKGVDRIHTLCHSASKKGEFIARPLSACQPPRCPQSKCMSASLSTV